MTMKDKAVLVTGANRGIGQALAAEALARGARRVYAGTRQPLAHTDDRVTPLNPGHHQHGADPGGRRAGRVTGHADQQRWHRPAR
jgi:NAD(P)-dependent dehydrogenase (short-subunit alcohol dehydrogenase family)